MFLFLHIVIGNERYEVIAYTAVHFTSLINVYISL